MDFFKFFDWPRNKIAGGTIAPQGSIVFTYIPYQVLTSSILAEYQEQIGQYLQCSGRPVNITFNAPYAGNDYDNNFFPGNLSGNQNLVVGVKIFRNGVEVYKKHERVTGINWTPLGVMAFPMSAFNWVDVWAPAGLNYYQVYYYATSARSIEAGATHITIWES